MNPTGPDSVYILLVQPDLYNSLFHMRPRASYNSYSTVITTVTVTFVDQIC